MRMLHVNRTARNRSNLSDLGAALRYSADGELAGKRMMTSDLAEKLRLLDGPVAKLPPPPTVERARRPRRLLLAAGAAALVVASVAGALFVERRLLSAPDKAVPVRAPNASAAPSRSELVASGFVVARRRATIAAQVTARVEQLFVEEGQRVTAGQAIARLDQRAAAEAATSARQSVAAAAEEEARLDTEIAEARREVQRVQTLAQSGFARRADLSRAETSVRSLSAQRRQATSRRRAAQADSRLAAVHRDNYVIRAPFSGIVVDLNAQPGEIISPISAGGGFTRTGICTIIDMSSLELLVDVSEEQIGRVRAGQPVTAVLDAYPDRTYRGQVLAVVPIADRARSTFRVRIAIQDADSRVLPEMAVRVRFEPSGAARPQ